MKFITDSFGKRHGIAISGQDSFKLCAVSRGSFLDITSAKTFLRSLGQSNDFWRQLLYCLPEKSPNLSIANTSLDQAAALLVRGKIVITEVSAPDSHTSPRQKRTIKTSDNKIISLLTPAEAGFENANNNKRFYSQSDAEKYLNDLNLSAENLDALLASLTPATKKSADGHQAIVEALMSGSLVSVEKASMPSYAPRSEAAVESNVPGSRPVPPPPPAESKVEDQVPVTDNNKDADQAQTLIDAAANGAAFCENCDAA